MGHARQTGLSWQRGTSPSTASTSCSLSLTDVFCQMDQKQYLCPEVLRMQHSAWEALSASANVAVCSSAHAGAGVSGSVTLTKCCCVPSTGRGPFHGSISLSLQWKQPRKQEALTPFKEGRGASEKERDSQVSHPGLDRGSISLKCRSQDLHSFEDLGSLGLPWWLRWYRICLQCRRPGFDPWVRKIPWRREWQPTPVFFLGKSHGQRKLEGYSP